MLLAWADWRSARERTVMAKVKGLALIVVGVLAMVGWVVTA